MPFAPQLRDAEAQKLREYIEQQRDVMAAQKGTIRELERNVAELTRTHTTNVSGRRGRRGGAENGV